MIERVLPARQAHPLFDIAASRSIEKGAAAGLPPFTLMARAGDALARLTRAVAPHARTVWVAAGPGNNGGDGLLAAALLQGHGLQVTVSLFGDAARRPPGAQAALARAQAAGVRIETGAAAHPASMADVSIDALLGIGARRGPEGAIAAAIGQLNALACPVIAVDLPSGLHADTGMPLGDACVVAAHTLSMLTLKPGLFTASGRDHAGIVWLDALGTDPGEVPSSAWLGARPGPAAARLHAQHKGSFGDVAVVGGAPGMSGAALLAGRAAHAAGAGRVFLQLLDTAAPALDPLHPELMFRGDWLSAPPETLARSTVVCGCGGGDAVRRVLSRVIALSGRLVLDADALNAIANDAGLAEQLAARARHGQPTVLTPHPLEAARLLGTTTAAVQGDRLAAAAELVRRYQAVVVLKGSGSVIAAPGQTPTINSTGNAALASAGTGDVLAGWLGGRWAQRPEGDQLVAAFGTACRAVAEHGAAAEPAPPGALLASELIERLHGA